MVSIVVGKYVSYLSGYKVGRDACGWLVIGKAHGWGGGVTRISKVLSRDGN
jgi:hypothetical protein